MKPVTILVGGKFYALQLAEQLEKRGCLGKVITSHPRWAFKSPKVDPRRIICFPIAEAVAQAAGRLSAPRAGEYWKAVLLDRFASTRLDDCGILQGFAGASLHSMRRKKGACPLVLERACPHILDQAATLREEASLFGLDARLDSRMVDWMIAEYALADRIVVPSRFSQSSFIARGFDPQRVPVVSLSGKFPPPEKPIDRRGRTVFRFLFVGGSFLRKGLIYLLRAWDGLGLKSAELVLRASDLPNVPEVRKLLRNPTVRRVDPVEDLGSLYVEASAFCLPSVDEGFGMVVLEAMSYGLPVLLTRNVGAADCVRDGVDGFMVAARDARALQEKILDLYQNEERRLSMGEAAREQSRKHTWDSYGESITQTLSRLA